MLPTFHQLGSNKPFLTGFTPYLLTAYYIYAILCSYAPKVTNDSSPTGLVQRSEESLLSSRSTHLKNFTRALFALIALSTAPVLANDVPTNDIALFELSDFHSAVNELKPAKKVVKRIRTEADYLAHWKEKQEALWANLPTEDFTINASAYTAAADECGKSDGITASGLKVKEAQTLACPPNFPFGTLMEIDGVGVRRCEDRGGAIKGNHIDIYVATKGEAFAFGRRNLTARIVNPEVATNQ